MELLCYGLNYATPLLPGRLGGAQRTNFSITGEKIMSYTIGVREASKAAAIEAVAKPEFF